MKKLIMITGTVLIAYLILVTMIAAPESAPSATTVTAQESTADSGYIIGISEGRVAVFRDGQTVIRTDTQLSDLPKSDRAKLEEGIHIDSLKELKERLEDYCS